MSLEVNWGHVSPPLTDQERNVVAFGVGVAMMATGMPEIKTEKDVVEIVTRLSLYEKLHGNLITDGTGHSANSVTFWTRWKGVSANVASKTRNVFVKETTWTFLTSAEYGAEEGIRALNESK